MGKEQPPERHGSSPDGGPRAGAHPSDLRERAIRLSNEQKSRRHGSSAIDARESCELEIYRLELELQNEDLVRAHAELEKSLERSMHLFDFAPMGYAILAPDGAIRAINHVGAELLRRSRGDLIGRRFALFVSLRHRLTFSDLMAHVWSDTALTNSLEFELLIGEEERENSDDEGPTLRLTAKSLLEEERAVLIAFEDVTLQRRAEEKLRRAEKELREADRRKDEFLGVLSHELRTPLSIVLLYSQLMQCEQFDIVKIREMAAALERAAKMQRRLIDDLLDVSRIVAGKFSITSETVDIAEVARESLEAVRIEASAKELELSADIRWPAAAVRGDTQRLQQALTNLLTNAVKFTPVGGRIELRIEKKDRDVQIEVVDNGAGFEATQLELLFQRFWQADRSPTRSAGGLGLGLSIARTIVEAHRGTLRASSAGPGHGSTFTIVLPVESEPSDAPAIGGRGERPTLARMTEQRILIVEDDAKTREVLRALFDSVQADVRTAESAAEALEVHDRFRPDLLVCDVAMPDEDGCSLMRRIRARGPDRGGNVPAVALTALAGNEDRQRTREAGFQRHLAKPADMNELLATVSALLQQND